MATIKNFNTENFDDKSSNRYGNAGKILSGTVRRGNDSRTYFISFNLTYKTFTYTC